MRDRSRTSNILSSPTGKSIQHTRKNPSVLVRGPGLKKSFKNTADPVVGKFQANWEGSYIVTRAGKSGSYALDKLDGTPVPRMWNAMHLKRYYQ